MKLTRKQLKEKYKELVFTYGKECMLEQIDEHYMPQSIRERLPGYKEEEDKLYLYKGQYLVKGYNVKYLENISEDEQQRLLTAMHNYKERILFERCKKRNEDLER